MKKSPILAPVVVGLLNLLIAPQVNAQATINPLSNGNFEVKSGDYCVVLFDRSGNVIRGGENCDDVEMYEAKKGMKSYLREQSSSGSEHMTSSTPEKIDTCQNAVSLKYGLHYSRVTINTRNDVMTWRLPNGRTGSCTFREDGSVIIPAG